MITILHIAEIILYIILAFNTGYLLLFAIASKFCRPRIYPRTAPGTKFAVLFPAYKEDKVIIPAIYSFLQQDYPRELYDIIVISDQMQESTNEALRQLPVRLLIADYTDSSKAKAMSLAMNATADIPYDAVVIMDADNTAGTSFLSELNPVFQSGARAVQAHRTAKNTNTDIAVLDAASESTTQYSAAGTSHSDCLRPLSVQAWHWKPVGSANIYTCSKRQERIRKWKPSCSNSASI
jgi:cellulose synthase/poly-beta-1,6-N-acetylglucosamine synthase-like glycosyltransferase